MPMPKGFKERLWPILPDVIDYFSTPFVIFDEEGIRDTYEKVDNCLKEIDHRLYFAVKATPIPEILRILQEMGAGFDCSSIGELQIVREELGADGDDIMFSSNNTTSYEFAYAFSNGGCIINFDDISLLDKIPKGDFPETVCFRYNPGARTCGNAIIGEPSEAKYGVTHNQIIEAYAQAQKSGAKKFGLHTMICSNSQDGNYLVDTVQMLAEVASNLHNVLGIQLDFINMGGGLGITYHPDDKNIDIKAMFNDIVDIIQHLGAVTGKEPKLLMEFGRYMTGPHGVLVTTVINTMQKYRKIIGVDASMPANPRPGIYGSYHHITVYGKEDEVEQEVVDIGGSLCEGCDKFAIQRELPIIINGDILIQDDVGAHAIAMGSDYNFRFIPKVLLQKRNEQVVCIRRDRDYDDHMALYADGDYGKTLQTKRRISQ